MKEFIPTLILLGISIKEKFYSRVLEFGGECIQKNNKIFRNYFLAAK